MSRLRTSAAVGSSRSMMGAGVVSSPQRWVCSMHFRSNVWFASNVDLNLTMTNTNEGGNCRKPLGLRSILILIDSPRRTHRER